MGVTQGKLEDRYFLQKVKLGQGSFGTVWRAVDRQNNNVVAIKQLEKAAMPRRGVRQQDIEREINVMQALQHENVTRLLDTFVDQKSIYLALEYCDGGDFGDKVKERGLAVSEGEAADWMRQILSAISALHKQGVCHRDIKPDNFMVHGETLKLADFGLAVFLTPGRLLTDKCGTPAFMAPEIHRLPRSSRGYNKLCDVWAAGVTMYMLMSGGRHPFLAASQKELDEKRLLAGILDFSVAQGFLGGIGLGECRFSEFARRLCKRLVEPDVVKRISAEEARADPWIADRARAVGSESLRPDFRRPERPERANTTVDKVPGGSPRSQGLWWPFKDENSQPNQGGESEAALQKRIQALEERVKMQQAELRTSHENQEAQFDALVDFKKVMQQLYEGEAAAGTANRAVSNELSHVGVLHSGVRCRYNSSSYTVWMPAVIHGFNDMDGTYNLDVRQHARPENISPAPDAPASEAWPVGTPVYYESSSMRHWLPAVVQSYNENGGEGTYNLDVRDGAVCDRIRPRHKAPGK
jgi:serine/threonine protein kinase